MTAHNIPHVSMSQCHGSQLAACEKLRFCFASANLCFWKTCGGKAKVRFWLNCLVLSEDPCCEKNSNTLIGVSREYYSIKLKKGELVSLKESQGWLMHRERIHHRYSSTNAANARPRFCCQNGFCCTNYILNLRKELIKIKRFKALKHVYKILR